MQFDYYAENPYKKDEAQFNSNKYKESNLNDKKILFKMLEKLGIL